MYKTFSWLYFQCFVKKNVFLMFHNGFQNIIKKKRLLYKIQLTGRNYNAIFFQLIFVNVISSFNKFSFCFFVVIIHKRVECVLNRETQKREAYVYSREQGPLYLHKQTALILNNLFQGDLQLNFAIKRTKFNLKKNKFRLFEKRCYLSNINYNLLKYCRVLLLQSFKSLSFR